MGVESYKHRYAKAVVCEWLRTSVEDGRLKWGPFDCRTNREAPMFGVFEEYPVTRAQQSHTWDEGWAGVNSDHVNDAGGFPSRLPTYDELRLATQPVEFILDIGIIHKGFLFYGIEVVHKHPVSDEKRQKLAAFKQWTNCSFGGVAVIEAEWVLSQVNKPKTLKITEWI